MKPIRFTEQMISDYVRMGYWDYSIVSDFWDRNAVIHPDKEAIVEKERRLTWSQAKKQIDRIAIGLLKLGIRRDDRVAVQLYNCSELFTFRLACEKAGIIAVTMLPNLRYAEVSAILKQTDAVGIAIPLEFRRFNYFEMIQKLKADIPRLRHIFVVGEKVPEGAISIKEMTRWPAEVNYPPDTLQKTKFKAFEVFQIATTTGTTGLPKCVEFISCVRQFTGKVIAKRLKMTSDDVIGAFAPVIAGGCFNEVYRAAPLTGARIVLAKYFTPEELLPLIEKEKITIIATVPTVLVRILNYPGFDRYDMGSLRIIKYGGAALPYEQGLKVWEKFKKPLLPAYGGLDVGTISSSSVDLPKEVLLRTVGMPLDGAEIKLVDENHLEAPPGDTGEIWVRGPHCQPGYYKDLEATSEVWQTGWFRTGDLGSFDGGGRLTIRGRRKDMILRGGQNIYPLEIENILLRHPKVLKAAIVGMPDREMGEKACAYVVLKPGEKFNLLDMTLFLKDQGIAAFKIPERLEIVDDLPLAGGIKVDKKRLRQEIETKLRGEGITFLKEA